MPTPEEVKARVALAYNHAADCYDHKANTFWDRFGRRTIERLDVKPGSHVLDVCCGAGASALPAAEACGERGRVVAVDLSEALIRLGQEKASRLRLRNIEFRVADMLALEAGDGPFAYIVCVFGLFFVPDMAGALRHLKTLLAPGGRIAVTTWGNGLFEPVNSIFWEAVRAERPELFKSFNPWDRLGDPSAVMRLFAEAGLSAPQVVFERARHPIRRQEDLMALLMGTGYRGVLEQLSSSEGERVWQAVCAQAEAAYIDEVGADVIYATWAADGGGDV